MFRTGLPYKYRRGVFTPATSGTLDVAQQYEITTFETGDDFSNVGAASNATGVKFVATGTTPTTWSNGSAVKRLGAIIHLTPESIGQEPSQWRDISGNGHHALMHTSGTYSAKELDTTRIVSKGVTITDSGVNLLRADAILPNGFYVSQIEFTPTDDGSSPNVTFDYDTGAATVEFAEFATVTEGNSYVGTPTVGRPSDAHNRVLATSASGDVTGNITITLSRKVQ